jgi:TolB-like protein/Tfp pilus assembly protein PilF
MKPSAQMPRVVRFGSFEADFRSGELRKSGIKLKIPGQPLQVLEVLLEHPGEMVSREELRLRLWRDDTTVDFENSLNTAVNKLREALGDTAASPRYVETLPRRGYRFLARLDEPARAAQRAPGAVKPMLVVLPFENLSGDPEQEYFADGMTEEMISQLGRLHASRLGVIARTSAIQYKGTRKSVREIAGELGVGFLLEGTVRRAGERVRITAQLIQASDQAHLWAESYDRTLDDILSIQTDVANRIGRSLATELLPAAAGRSATPKPEAYEAYLKGRFHWNKRTEAGLQKALGYFQECIEKDPAYALPYVGLAEIYGALGLYSVVGWNAFLPPGEACDKAKAAAAKALEIDSSLAEAHTSLAFAKFLYDWDWKGAEEQFQIALKLNSNHVEGRCWYALFLAAMARFDEALDEMGRARELDPLSLTANAYLGWILYFARRYDEAMVQLRGTVEMDPHFPLARFFLGLVCIRKTTYREAIDQFGKAFESLGDPGVFEALRAAYAQALRGEIASRVDARLLSPYLMVILYLSFGSKEAAFEQLERAYQERSCWLVNLKVEPALDSLRSDPRFESLLRRVGLPE